MTIEDIIKQQNWFTKHPLWAAIGIVVTIVFLRQVFNNVSSSTSIVTPTPNSPTTKIKDKPSPTSTDPCAQYAGTDQMATCANLEDARQKGLALQRPLKAAVTFNGLYLFITNTESNEWDNCVATLDDTNPEGDNYQSDIFTLKPGEEQTISWGNFANLENQRFDYYQTKPTFVDVDCTVSNQEHRSLFNL